MARAVGCSTRIAASRSACSYLACLGLWCLGCEAVLDLHERPLSMSEPQMQDTSKAPVQVALCDPGAECCPRCDSAVCGDDGCGGSCGACARDEVCREGQCRCQPREACDPDVCGTQSDGCGGRLQCAECARGQVCNAGSCCTPRTTCGDACGAIADGCGGSLECSCGVGTTCLNGACRPDTPPPPSCGPAPASLCEELPRLLAEPVIDGTLDCDLSLRALAPVGWTESGAPIPAGVAVRYAAAWWTGGLYVYVEVDDPDARPAPAGTQYYCGDSVEIDVVLDDGALGDYYRWPGSGQVVIRAPDAGTAPGVPTQRAQTHAHTGASDFDGPFDWAADRTFAAYRRADGRGYTVEAFVTAAAVGGDAASFAQGGRLGFDIGLNVSAPIDGSLDHLIDGCDGDGARLGQFYLRTSARDVDGCSDNGDPWCTPSALCHPVLR